MKCAYVCIVRVTYHTTLLLCMHNRSINIPMLGFKGNVRFNYCKADYGKILLEMKRIDWKAKFKQHNTVDQIVSEFYQILDDVIQHFVLKLKSTKLGSKYSAWFSTSLTKILHDKDNARVKFCRSWMKVILIRALYLLIFLLAIFL